FGLLGPNGSGKSTALRLLLGFIQPTIGHALIAGHDCWTASVAARRHVSYLPGELRLYENMTGRQLVRFLSRLRGAEPRGDVDAMARRLDIDLDRPLAQMSSGMKRKVALLQVLAPQAPLLILDEPTNTLDPTMRDELLAQLRQARDQGQAVAFSSHGLGEGEQGADRVAILQRGRLVHLQKMSELREVRVIHVRLAHAPGTLPELPGLRRHSLASSPETSACTLLIEFSGRFEPLLAWLSEQPVLDMRM